MKNAGPHSADMLYWFETEGLTYHMETQRRYRGILGAAGFIDIEMIDIADEYRAMAREEYESTRGTLKPSMIEALGVAGQARFEETWRAMTVGLGKGELRSARFWVRRPESAAHAGPGKR